MLDFIQSTLLRVSKIFETTPAEVLQEKGGGGNWVTKKDVAIERYVIEQIKKNYPTHSILSEETEQDIDSLDKSNLWIFDPLDGTTNAFYGLPNYAVSLAFSRKGEVKIGGIYNIPNKTLYYAEKGRGAFMQSVTQSSQVKLTIKESRLKNALVCTGSPYSRENFISVYKLMDKVHQAGARLVILGSAVVACCYVAEGKLSMYFEKGLKPWDIATASLLIQESGGIVRNIEGELDILQPKTFVCGNKVIVDEFLSLT